VALTGSSVPFIRSLPAIGPKHTDQKLNLPRLGEPLIGHLRPEGMPPAIEPDRQPVEGGATAIS